MLSDVRVVEVQPEFTHEIARTPLKFGAVVMDRVTFFRCRVVVENGRGQTAEGFGGIFLADFWGFPSKVVPHEQRDQAMRLVAERYCQTIADYGQFAHPIAIFMEHEQALREINRAVCQELGLAEQMPFLGALICAAPVDAAIHDAFGNVNGICSYDGYGPEFMDWDLSRYLGPEFRGKYPAQYIRDHFLPEIPVFHLVGGLDKLTESEVDESDPQDGRPNSLEAWIRQDGVFCLKVKLRGNDMEWDLERTLAVHEIGVRELEKLGRNELYMSLDTNEQCHTPEYMIELLQRLRERSPQAFDDVLYIEQPTERDLCARRFDMRPLGKLKPVIVDESLTDLESFELARELGWTGIALKTCKGHSADLLFVAKASEAGMPYTVQDLTNPSLALIHSVGLAARLYTIKGVEANSRQFFPESTRPGEREVHGAIFNVRNGVARTASLQGTGLCYQMDRIRALEQSA